MKKQRKMLSLVLALMFLVQAPLGVMAKVDTVPQPSVEESTDPGVEKTHKVTVKIDGKEEAITDVKDGESFTVESVNEKFDKWVVAGKETKEIADKKLVIANVTEDLTVTEVLKEEPVEKTYKVTVKLAGGTEAVEEVKENQGFTVESKDDKFEKWVVAGKETKEVTDKKLVIANVTEDLTVTEVLKKEEVKPVDSNLVSDFLSKVHYSDGLKDGKLTLNFPAPANGYEAHVTISNKGTTDAKVYKVTGVSTLDLAYLKTPYTVAVKLVRTADKMPSEELSKELKSPAIKAPVINYIYSFDGGVIINATADLGVKDVYWAYEGERDFTRVPSDGGFGTNYRYRPEDKTKKVFGEDFYKLFENTPGAKLDRYTRFSKNDYRINIRIPSVINLVIVDNDNNLTTKTLKIEKDNVAITEGVPEEVEKALKDAMNFTYTGNREKYQDLLVIDKNTTVNLFDTFKDHIIKNLERFNSLDLTWDFIDENNKETIPYTGVYKFTDAGVYNIKVTDLTSGKEALMTVVVNEGRNNLRSYSLIKNDIEVDKDNFTGLDALKVVKYVEKDEVNALSMVMVVDGKYYRISDEIPFGNKSEVKVKIIDLKTNKTYDVTFRKGAVVKGVELTDISGHWAEDLIKQLVDKGVIKGYEDKTFKPNNMITIRETLAILGRYAKRNETLVNPVVRDNKIMNQKDKDGKLAWGYDDITYAANRLSVNIFEGQDIDKEAITREQVAFVMDQLYKIDKKSGVVKLTDVNESKYSAQIENLYLNKVIHGYPEDNTFKPELEITRAELASLLFSLPLGFK